MVNTLTHIGVTAWEGILVVGDALSLSPARLDTSTGVVAILSPMTTTQTTPDQLRTAAAALEQDARDSFERCDTDGFLSQWASNIGARHKHAEAALIERGGVSEFLTLFDTDGNWVPSKMIETKYGRRWMVLDADGRRTGEFLPVLPKRQSTLASKGYAEGYAMFPARIDYIDNGGGVAGLRVGSIRTTKDHEPPTMIVSRDRFADPSRFGRTVQS